jgi:hypothetical protein
MVHCTSNTRKIENSHTRISFKRDLPVYSLLVYVGKFFEFLLIVLIIFTFAYTYTAYMYFLHTCVTVICKKYK